MAAYYYSLDGTSQQGPVEADRLAGAGVGPQTMVWREGMAEWQPAGRVPELAGLFEPAAPARPLPNRPAPLPHASPGQSMPLPPGGLMHPQYATPNRVPGTNGMAIASLVLGIIGIVSFCCFVPAVLAIVFGHIARGQIRRGMGTGEGFALTGLILGYAAIILFLFGVVIRVNSHGLFLNGHRYGP